MKKVLFVLVCLFGLLAAHATDYVKVTDAATLQAGDKLIVVGAVQKDSKDYAMGPYSGGNNCPAVEVTIIDGKISNPEGVAVITLEGSEGEWNLSTDSGYLYAANTGSSKNNYLKAQDDPVNWTIAIATSTAYATMTSAGGGNSNRNVLRYNNSGTSNLFSCYASGQQDIYIYREESTGDPNKENITLTWSETKFTYDMDEAGAQTFPTLTVEPDNLTIAYSSSDEAVATINAENGVITPIAAGSTTITASFAGDATYNEASASYILTVYKLAGNGEGTLENPYDVARALSLITQNRIPDGNVYVTGTITGTPSVSTSYGNATYDIVDAGEAATLTVYRGYYSNDDSNKNFTSEDQIKVNDVVVVCGTLIYYNNTTPQVAANNYIVTLNGKSTLPTTKTTTIEFAEASLELVLGEDPAANVATVMCQGEAVEGAVVTYTSSNAEVATVDAAGVVTPVASGTATITATYDGEENVYLGCNASYVVTVVPPSGVIVAGTYTFGSDWNAVFGTSYTGSFSTSADALTLEGSVGGITLNAVNGSSKYGYVKEGDFRAYDGYTLTFTAPDGYSITEMSSAKGGKNFTSGITSNPGTLTISNNTISWTGKAATVVLNCNGTVSFSTISVKIEDSTSGIEAVEVEAGEAQYYNLQGVRVANPQGGIFIRVQGGKASKVIM